MTLFVVFVCSKKGQVKQMNTIQDLYYGRISPYEMGISAAPEYQKLKVLADKNEDLLSYSSLRVFLITGKKFKIKDQQTAEKPHNYGEKACF